MSARTKALLAGAFLLAAAARGEPEAPRARFVYGGDARFAPFDYLDAHGQPTGFNVELLRRVASEAGVDLEVRLSTWNDARTAFDEGRLDIISLSYAEDRAQTYDWLAQTWWMHQCVLFRAGRGRLPAGSIELSGETVAVQERSAVAELLFRQMPPKPSLITVRTQDDALALLERGVASGVAGNSLSLRVAAAERGLGELVEMPLRAVPYGFMAKKGRAAELDWVVKGLARLREEGGVEALAERFLATPPPRPRLPPLASGLFGLALVLAVVAAAAALRGRACRTRAEREAQAEQDRLQCALRKADAEWQRTVDAVDTCVVILDGEGRIRHVNRAARELLGHDDARILNRHIEQLDAAEPWLSAARLLREASGPGTPSSMRAADRATTKTWDLTLFRAADPHGVDQRLILVVRDISRLVALRGARRRRETMAALGSLVTGLAHEIRNPLFSVSASLDALEDEFGARPEYAEFARPLRNQVARLTRLTRDLLDYGRSPALKPSRVNVPDLLRVAVDACADRARERGVHLLLEVAPGLPVVEVDVGRMEQVLENLIANAVQHSPGGRTVRIAAGPGAVEETIELSVADQGLGLSDDDIPRVFEPFFRRRDGGTGLGLSIVQRIVESHGGRVTVANQRPAGAVFTVTVPRTPPIDACGPAHPSCASEGMSGAAR
jgi:PAS domain S-box-containing protein